MREENCSWALKDNKLVGLLSKLRKLRDFVEAKPCPRGAPISRTIERYC